MGEDILYLCVGLSLLPRVLRRVVVVVESGRGVFFCRPARADDAASSFFQMALQYYSPIVSNGMPQPLSSPRYLPPLASHPAGAYHPGAAASPYGGHWDSPHSHSAAVHPTMSRSNPGDPILSRCTADGWQEYFDQAQLAFFYYHPAKAAMGGGTTWDKPRGFDAQHTQTALQGARNRAVQMQRSPRAQPFASGSRPPAVAGPAATTSGNPMPRLTSDNLNRNLEQLERGPSLTSLSHQQVVEQLASMEPEPLGSSSVPVPRPQASSSSAVHVGAADDPGQVLTFADVAPLLVGHRIEIVNEQQWSNTPAGQDRDDAGQGTHGVCRGVAFAWRWCVGCGCAASSST